jgi:REP element-mobilizing transposase RayT
MVLGYHIIFGAYGFWLPNDPRGSWSTEVWAEDLRPLGPATKVATRRSVASKPHDYGAREDAKRHLKYPTVQFNGQQALAISRGIADIADKIDLTIYACAIMPDHVHLVVKRHAIESEVLTGYLTRAATRALNKSGLNPMTAYPRPNGRLPSPWSAGGGWQVYLDSPNAIRRAIQYVEANPVKAGLHPQRWSFVESHRRGVHRGGPGDRG